jgi:translation initiation factor IF-2
MIEDIKGRQVDCTFVQTQTQTQTPFTLTLSKTTFDFKVKSNELGLIVVCDMLGGSLEAIKHALSLLLPSNEHVFMTFLRGRVGEVSLTDLELAQISGAKIITFNSEPSKTIKLAAKDKGVELWSYFIIYRLLDDICQLLTVLLPKTYMDQTQGTARVIRVFVLNSSTSRRGDPLKIAGCMVLDGIIKQEEAYSLGETRVLRNEQVIHVGKIKEFKQMKRNIVTASKGMECGIMFDDFSDFQEGDTIQYVVKKEITSVL